LKTYYKVIIIIILNIQKDVEIDSKNYDLYNTDEIKAYRNKDKYLKNKNKKKISNVNLIFVLILLRR